MIISIKNILLLLKMNLKTTFSYGNKANKKPQTKTRKTINKVGMIALAVFLVVYFGGLATVLSMALYEGLAPLGLASALLGLTSGIMGYVIILFSIFYMISVFYYSKDLEMLLSLPVRGVEILSSKFLTILMFEYITTIIAFIPFIYYGIREGCGILYYIYMIISVIFLPIIPLCLAAIVIMLLMRFVKFARNKDVFMLISSLVVMAIAIGFSLFIQKNATSIDFTSQTAGDAIVNMSNNIFPVVTFSAQALKNSNNISGFLYLLAFVGISIVAFAVVLFIGKFLYIKSASLISSSSPTSKKLKNSELDIKPSPIYFKLIKKDFLVMLRTPIFLMNNLLPVIILPVCLFVMSFSGGSSTGFGEILKTINFADPNIINFAIFSGIAIGIISNSFNSISCTALSREGSSFALMKIIPISYKVQILSKCAISAIVGELSIFMLLAAIAVMAPVPLFLYIIVFLMATLSNIAMSALLIFVDLRSPKLNWATEQEAVKQNMNTFIAVLLGMLLAGIFIAIAIVTTVVLHIPALILIPLVVLFTIAFAVGSVMLISKISDKYMNQITC